MKVGGIALTDEEGEVIIWYPLEYDVITVKGDTITVKDIPLGGDHEIEINMDQINFGKVRLI